MAKYLISMHPNATFDENFLERIRHHEPLTDDEKRYVAEHNVTLLTYESTTEEWVTAFSELLFGHLSAFVKYRSADGKDHHYSNPMDFFEGEAARKKDKTIKYTPNIAEAHLRIKDLNARIVTELSRKDKTKNLFLLLLFGIIFLALAIFSTTSGGAVKVLTALINSEWIFAIFVIAVLGLSLYFGFFAIGIVLVGALVLLAWLVLEVPVVVSVIVNGILFIAAAVLLILAISELKDVIHYKPMTDKERERNQQLIAERDKLREELAEYSDAMIEGINIIKRTFEQSEKDFLDCSKWSFISCNAEYASRALSYLTKYYGKMKR